jgi:hypothetical protein
MTATHTCGLLRDLRGVDVAGQAVGLVKPDGQAQLAGLAPPEHLPVDPMRGIWSGAVLHIAVKATITKTEIHGVDYAPSIRSMLPPQLHELDSGYLTH